MNKINKKNNMNIEIINTIASFDINYVSVLVSVYKRNINISIKRLKNNESRKNIQRNSYCLENNRNTEGKVCSIMVLDKYNKYLYSKYVLNMIIFVIILVLVIQQCC